MVVPLILEDALSSELSSAEPAEVFTGTPEAAALLLRDAVQLRAAQEGPVQVATAESLTGGDVGGAICTVPGASAYYRGGVISYAYEVKAQVLGVDAQLLAREGAVHPAVAVQMAVGAARVCGADYAVSTTGVAGPDPADGQPVGTVYIGVCSPGGSEVFERHYSGDRAQIRAAASADAIALLARAEPGTAVSSSVRRLPKKNYGSNIFTGFFQLRRNKGIGSPV